MGTASPVNGLIAYEPLKTPVTLRSAMRSRSVRFFACGQGRRLLPAFWAASGQLGYQITFRSQNHEGHTEHGICAGSKDGKFDDRCLSP